MLMVIIQLGTSPEYKDDSHIIPRSSSVIVKRLPPSRPGKGKAAMYIAGASGAVPVSDTVQKGGSHGSGTVTWHKGAMSKRFDVKDEPSTSQVKPSAVS